MPDISIYIREAAYTAILKEAKGDSRTAKHLIAQLVHDKYDKTRK